VAVGLVGLTATTAVAVRLTAATEARELLGFTFRGLPHRPSESVAIFVNNVRVLGAILAACGIVQLAWGSLTRVAVGICDVALLVGSVLQIVLIGTAFGAYGRRVLETVFAHAPFELLAFSLGLGLYLEARRTRLSMQRVVTVTASATTALAIGAVVEVFA